jgi:hypothetical protein
MSAINFARVMLKFDKGDSLISILLFPGLCKLNDRQRVLLVFVFTALSCCS